jgi:hypothetical protein
MKIHRRRERILNLNKEGNLYFHLQKDELVVYRKRVPSDDYYGFLLLHDILLIKDKELFLKGGKNEN